MKDLSHRTKDRDRWLFLRYTVKDSIFWEDDTMIHCAICDDDNAVAEILLGLMKQYSAELDCTAFGDPLILQSTVCGGQKFDIYILDIVMPGLTGVDLAREIHRIHEDGIIIFLTSSDEFHKSAFEVEALQYLDKPVVKEKLYRTLDRALQYIGENESKLLTVQTKDGVNTLDVNQIIYVESFRHTLTFHLDGGSSVQTLDSSLSLEKLTKELRFPPFCVPYRGFIINMNHVDCMQKFRFSMSTGDVIPIPQKHFSKVRQQYSDYMLTRFRKGDA